jgi:hypothetical protein
MRLRVVFAAFFAPIIVTTSTAAGEGPMEYVIICQDYGDNYFKSPGTETCVNAQTGETRKETEDGTQIGSTVLKSRVDDIERRINNAFSDIYRQLHEEASIAAALADPDLVAGERFGIRLNWANAGSANAFAFTGAAVLRDGLFGETGRLTGSAGIGFSGGTVGGRAGLQLTW